MSLDVLDWRRRTHDLYQRVRIADDPRTGHAAWVRERSWMLAEHPAAPRQGTQARHAPYDPRWRAEVEVAETVDDAERQRIEVATGTDGIVPFVRIGRVEHPAVGELDVWWLDSYGGGLWLPMRDASPDTYGGGRYVLDTVKGADLGGTRGSLVIDLNFAYNPSCAYDEAWACPLAPPGNVVSQPVEAGELLPG